MTLYSIITWVVIIVGLYSVVTLWRTYSRHKIPSDFHGFAGVIFVLTFSLLLTQFWSLYVYQIGEWFHKLPALIMCILPALYSKLSKKHKMNEDKKPHGNNQETEEYDGYYWDYDINATDAGGMNGTMFSNPIKLYDLPAAYSNFSIKQSQAPSPKDTLCSTTNVSLYINGQWRYGTGFIGTRPPHR